MSLQLRYCEDCGRAWPVAKGAECLGCGEDCPARDAITVIHNLHRALADAKPKEPK